MIEWISTWAEQIVVAVIIASIIEMLLPNGNNKKYIKAIIGVYILFTIISPIIGKFVNIDLKDIDYEKYFKEVETQETISQSLTTNNEKTMGEIYISNLKADMKNKLEEKGYRVENINLNVELEDEKSYGKINEIVLEISKSSKESENITKETNNTIAINKIEEVKIGNKIENEKEIKREISNGDKNEVKDYLASVYDVKKKNIRINEN
ncbi:MAG: stage III sporulation protein AF [Clostridia bacterium]|nr:stage III sporulation protein AF [Clostridia bacterium]